MQDFLKTKCLSLAAEAKIIRRLERHRLKKARSEYAHLKGKSYYHYAVFHGLRDHRIGVVREESRIANIAYGFLKGHAYRKIETNAKNPPNWKRIGDLVEKYGEGDCKDRMELYKIWKDTASASFEKK